jgi:ribosomal protein S18 acetylase RimI-like enzyme
MNKLLLLIILLLCNKNIEYFGNSLGYTRQFSTIGIEEEKDPYLFQKGNVFFKEYKSMSKKDRNELKRIFSKCFTNNEKYSFSEDTVLLLYYVNKKLVGYVGLLTTPQLEKYLANNYNWASGITLGKMYGIINQHGLYFYNLCVLPEYRNKKIGHSLLLGVLNYANKIRAHYIHLTVFSHNKIPIKMYKKYKFREFYVNHDNLSRKIITMIKYIR